MSYIINDKIKDFLHIKFFWETIDFDIWRSNCMWYGIVTIKEKHSLPKSLFIYVFGLNSRSKFLTSNIKTTSSLYTYTHIYIQVFTEDTYLHWSSSKHNNPFGFPSIKCKQAVLSRNSISFHLIPSLRYSSCSYLNTCWLK